MPYIEEEKLHQAGGLGTVCIGTPGCSESGLPHVERQIAPCAELVMVARAMDMLGRRIRREYCRADCANHAVPNVGETESSTQYHVDSSRLPEHGGGSILRWASIHAVPVAFSRYVPSPIDPRGCVRYNTPRAFVLEEVPCILMSLLLVC